MQADRTEAIFAMTLEATRRRIARDAPPGGGSLGKIFAKLAETFNSADFTIAGLTPGVRLTRGQRDQFRVLTGGTMKAYVDRCKCDIAAELLVKTRLGIHVIAERLHYGPSNFTRVFKRLKGQTPQAFRASRCGPGRKLPRHDLQEAIRHRAGLSPFKAIFGSKGGALGKTVAWTLWEVLRDETEAMQNMILRRGKLRLERSSLFNILSQQSREAGRRDPAPGVALGKLALAFVEGSAMGRERRDELAALALARLGDAHRLAGDQAHAERALGLAGARLKAMSSRPSSRIHAEIRLLEGTLRASQRRFEAALELLDESARFARESADHDLLVRAILRGAAVFSCQGRQDQVVLALREIEQVLKSRPSPDLGRLMLVYQELSLAYLELGDQASAEELFQHARALSDLVPHAFTTYQLTWIEGLLAASTGDAYGAEKLFRRARSGFSKIGEPGARALSSLHIAILCSEQNRHDELMVLLTAEVMPVLEPVHAGLEFAEALQRVEAQIAARDVTTDALLTLRETLHKIRPEPRAT